MKSYKSLVAAAVLATMVGTTAFAAATAVPLKDINNYWGKDAIQYFYDNHYISGVNGNFNPNESITREGVASIISNVIGDDTSTAKSKFTDVQGRWSEKAIASLVDKKIMNGYANGAFKPDQAVTRQEFAVTAYNYMNYKGIGSGLVAESTYTDDGQIAPWAKKAVNALAAEGFMTGSNNFFRPQDKVTRGEAVSVLYRIMNGSQVKTDVSTKVEEQVFNDISEVYGSVKKFADDGVMYWQGDKLHVGCKDNDRRQKLADTISKDSLLPANTVVVQHAAYSYNDYKKIMDKAETTFRATEPTDAAVKSEVDYLNEKVVLTVSSITKETQDNIVKNCGNAVKIVIQ